jgi:hypothetical protein
MITPHDWGNINKDGETECNRAGEPYTSQRRTHAHGIIGWLAVVASYT